MLYLLNRYCVSAIILMLITGNAYAQLATYVGTAGTSTAVTGYPNETVTALQYTGFGTNTACGSGGRSGITVNTTWNTYNTAGPRLFIQIRPNAGYQLNVTGFNAGLRSSGTGPVCARFAYSLNNGATWIDDGACHSPNVGGGCGTTAVSAWSGGALPTAITNTTNGIIVAIFPYQPGAATGTFQVNTLNILGTVTSACIPPAAISGATSVCATQTVSLSNTVAGGTWSSGNTAVATIGAAGVVTGVSGGQAVVTYATGCGTNATATVTVNPLPVAGTISGTPIVCVGAVTSLSSTSPGGVWSSANTGLATVNNTGNVTGVSMGSATVSYSVTNGCGTDVASVAVTVNPLPVSGSVSGVPTVCKGLTMAIAGGVPGGVWSSSTTTVATVTGSGVVTGVDAGNAIISYSVTNSCGTAVATASVSVLPLPLPFAVNGGGHYCNGFSGVLVGLNGSEPGVSYQLYNGVAMVGPAINGTGLAFDFGIQTVAGNYTVVAENMVTHCTLIMTGSATVIIDPLPYSFAITGGGANCSGTGVHIGLANSVVGVSYQLYNGTIPASAIFPGTGLPLDFGAVFNSGGYTVWAVDGVTACATTMSGNPIVTITPSVTPSVSIVSASGGTVCSGTPVTYTPVAVHGGTAPFYEWSVNGTMVATGNAYSYIPANGDVVAVKLTSNVVCPLPDTASDTMSMVVYDSQVPAVNITVSRSNLVCTGERVTFTPTPVFGGTAPLYRWMKNGVQVATGASYNYIPLDGDNVSCIMKSNFACLVRDSAIGNIVRMTVKPLILPSVSIAATPGTLVAAGEMVTLKATVTNPGGTSLLFQWLKNGVPHPGGNSDMIIGFDFGYPHADSFTCIVTPVGHQCGPIQVFNWVYIKAHPVGIEDVYTVPGQVIVWPNPNTGEFTVKGSSTNAQANEEVFIDMVNMLGQAVYHNKVAINNGTINEQITTSSLPDGLYVLYIRSESGTKALNLTIKR